MWETDFLIDKTQKAQLDTERHICIDTESQSASLINNINISHLRAIVCKYMQKKIVITVWLVNIYTIVLLTNGHNLTSHRDNRCLWAPLRFLNTNVEVQKKERHYWIIQFGRNLAAGARSIALSANNRDHLPVSYTPPQKCTNSTT